jgi:hypothetical protein
LIDEISWQSLLCAVAVVDERQKAAADVRWPHDMIDGDIASGRLVPLLSFSSS